MNGWVSSHRQTAAGAVESEQRFALAAPVVPFSEAGAERLGRAYWREVERATCRLVRPRVRHGLLELRLFGAGPALLRFGVPTLVATRELASCSYPIDGGLLAQRAGGAIVFAQIGSVPPVIRSAISGFFPRLAARAGRPGWTGAVYDHLQSRVHLAISRRYFARLIAESQE